MTVRELVVKLVLDAAGFRSDVDRAQGNLAQLGNTARDTGERTASGFGQASRGASELGDRARTAGAQTAASMERAADKAAALGDEARTAGHDLQQAAERGERGLGGLSDTLDKTGAAARDAGAQAASGFDRAARGASSLGDRARTAGAQTAASMERAADKAAALGDEARAAGHDLQQAAQHGDRGFGALLGTLGKVTGILGGMAAITSTVTNYVGAVTEIDKTSQMLGMSMEAWQGWAYAARQAGLEADDVRDRLADLGDWTLDLNVNDAGPLKDFAEKTKTSFKDAQGATTSIQESFFRIVDTVNKMDRQEATSWLVQMGFDEKTIALFFKGRKGLEEYLKTGKEQALYSKRDAENARRLREAWQGVEQVYHSVAATILRALGPVFDWLAKKADKMARWVQEHEDTLTVFLTTLAMVISSVLIPALLNMGKAALVATGPLRPFILAAMLLAAVIDDLWAFMEGRDSAIEKFLTNLGVSKETIENVRQTVRNLFNGLRDLWNFLTGQGEMPTWLDNLIPDWLKAAFSGGKKAEAAGIGGGGAPGVEIDNEDDAVFAAQDAARALSYRAGDSARPAGPVNNSRHVETNIGQITVQTQASDADGIARDLGGALQNQTAQADGANGV